MNLHTVILATATAFVVSGCPSKTWVQEIADGVEPLNCTPYVPPRSDHGPGWVYTLSTTADGRTIQRAVCNQIFDNIALNESEVSVPNATLTRDKSFGLSASVLDGLIKNVNSATANLKAGGVDSLKIVWGPAKSLEMTDSTWWDGQKARQITPSCAQALKQMREKGEFDNNVFVVQSSILASKFTLEAKSDSNNSLSGGLSLFKLLDFKPEINVKETGTSSLAISAPRQICYSAVLLKEYRESTQFGPPHAVFVGERLKASNLRNVVK